MPVDLESELARLGAAWSESVAHVDVAEVLERTMITRSQPIDDMDDEPATNSDRRRLEPRSRRSGQRWLVAAACTALVVAGVVALAQRQTGGPEPAPTNTATTPSVPIDTAAPLPPPSPSPLVTVPPLAAGTSGGMWPQSTLEEVRAAQELADAGDPAYVWQLDANMAADEEPWGAEIFARFIEEELGWEGFAGASFAGYIGADGGGQFEGVLFIRCAPGQTNPLSPLYAEAPAEIRGCAPTIDEFAYETVSFSVTQPERRGPSGIWVVDRWEIQSKSDPYSLYGLLYRDYLVPGQAQVEQVAPPSDAEVSALLEAFLRARVDGEDAEQYLLREPQQSMFEDKEVPLLYATTSGAPYERSEMQRVQGPVWPNGWTEYKVRLFAGDETVVEQYFHVVRRDGQLGLLYGYDSNGVETTENGQSLALPRNEFGDTLTFTSPPLVPRGDGRIEIALAASSAGRVVIGEDPLLDSVYRQDCWSGTAPARAADAAVLARSIEADPDFETTETVPVSIAGIDGLQMDVTFSEPNLCYGLWSYTRGETGGPPWHMRLYLVDFPESAWPSDSNWRPEVLTVAVIAPETDFERVLKEATRIVESIEFTLADGD